MYFNTKNYLKNTYNYITKHTHSSNASIITSSHVILIKGTRYDYI
jgi:hypothetical protein